MTKLSKLFIWSAFFVSLVFGIANISFARTWMQSGTEGMGDTNNKGFYGFEQLVGQLFVGTYNNTAGAQVFSSPDGINWLRVSTGGLGDVNNQAYNGGHVVFNNNVYVCTRNPFSGTEMWRVPTSGILYAAQVNTDGFGKGAANTLCMAIKEYKGMLYTGTENIGNGGELYVSGGDTTWTQVGANGFGDTNNVIFESLEVFGNYLYLGTYNAVTGGEVWRTADGVIWSQVNVDGFGNNLNIGVLTLKSFGNYLYAGTGNIMTGGEIWRSSDGLNWQKTSFSSVYDFSVSGMYEAGDRLFVGTQNVVNGAAIFETTDGQVWTQTNQGGFGVAGILGLFAVRDFGLMGDYLYAGANTNFLSPIGGRVYKADVIAPTITASPDNKVSRKKIKVTLSSNDSSGSIYYTIDGSEPSIASTKYSKTLTFKKTKILKFIGVDIEGNISSVSTKYFIVTSYPYLYNANKELREKNGTIEFYNISTGKYGKKFKPFSSGLKYFTVADPNQDNKTEIIANNGSEIKVYNSKRKLKYTLNISNDYLAFGDIDNSKKEKTLIAKAKILKIYNKISLVKTFNFSENIKNIAVGRVLKYDQPLIIIGFDNKIKLYQYKNSSLVLKKTKTLVYSKLMAYDLDTDGLDNIMYSKNNRVYVLNKKLKKKFSFKGGSSFLSVADVNSDYLLETLVSTGKKLKTYSNIGILLSSKKDLGKWQGVKF